MKHYINGRFLLRKTTGVERYATEIIRALDRILFTRCVEPGTWTILVPPGPSVPEIDLRTIVLQRGGSGSGHHWEQLSLASLAADGKLINLANSGPIRHRRSVTIIHDAIVYRRPKLFSFPYRNLHRALGLVLSRTSRLGTVSEFSRGELSTILRVPVKNIFVVPNGSDHLGKLMLDGAILNRLGLEAKRFFLFVGSPAPHKNLARALDAYASLRRSDHRFVIVGTAQANVFDKENRPLPEGTVAAGRLSDSEVAALYSNATALVFPSLYEGFGIPPLEAMSFNCPVIAADIPPVREVCADAANYFDPTRVEDIARAMRVALSIQGAPCNPAYFAARLAAFTWEQSAMRLLAEVERA